jgi:hypothetical protein
VTSKPPPAVVSKPPPAVASKPAAARGARLTPKPPGVTPKPPAAQAKAKASPSRSRSSRSPRDKGERPSRDRLDSHAEGFFAQGEAGLPPVHEDVLPPSIFSPERRAALFTYLGIALALVVVVAAFVFMRSESTPQPTVTALPPDPLAVPSSSLPPIPPIPQPSAVASNATPPAAGSASAAVAAASSAAPASSASAAATPEAPTKSAAEEKTEAQKALDHGKTKDAIEAAARSTALDPTDADAWLLLGAANMELGKTGDARAAFSACSKQATRGQIAECRSMLR